MQPSVHESWQRVETWLDRHAPATSDALRPPASASAITEAERALGLSFPAPLAQSLLRHDGTDGRALLPPFWALLGTREIVAVWRSRTAIARRAASADTGDPADPADPAGEPYDPDADHGPWWDRRWIPFASDGCGNDLVVDLRSPTRPGRIGQADHEQGCFFSPRPGWSSLPELLDTAANAMESGEVVGDCERVVTAGGVLEWAVL